MNEFRNDAATPAVIGRLPMQERSKIRRDRITQAVIELLGTGGEARLTHRDVADRAGVSLAATTYYYSSKQDLLADASQAILRRYVQTFQAFVERHRDSSKQHPSFQEAMRRLTINGVVRERRETIAWCEIMAACGRSPETRALASEWYRSVVSLWSELAGLLGGPADSLEVVYTLDQVVGLLYLSVPLELGKQDMERALSGNLGAVLPHRNGQSGNRQGPEGDTRQRIIDSAISLMARHGAGAVSGRRVAGAAGLAPTAPGYYFKPITELLAAARNHLYEGERTRFGELLTVASQNALDVDGLVDLLTAILIREVTQFGELNLASLSIDVEAARERSLRPVVALRRESEEKAWAELLELCGARRRASDPLVAMSMFFGMKVRLLATGCSVSDLAAIRKQFCAAINAFRDCQRIWI